MTLAVIYYRLIRRRFKSFPFPADGAPRNWSSFPQLQSVSVLSAPVLVESAESLFNVTSSTDDLQSVPSVSFIISGLENLHQKVRTRDHSLRRIEKGVGV